MSRQARIHSPIAGTVVDTSPHALGIRPEEEKDGSSSSKGRVTRAVEKTVDKLGRSISGKAMQLPPSPSSQKRLFSMSRKGKGKDKAFELTDNQGDLHPSLEGSTHTSVLSSRPTSPLSPLSAKATPHDDSPFIRPPSPSIPSGRSQSFRGDGTMRAGTQTLIQALQAIPWTDDPDNDEDITPQELSSADSDNDEENKPGDRLASSIHTIYRPLARSRRADMPLSSSRSFKAHTLGSEEEQDSEGTLGSESEAEAEDFEDANETTPRPSHARPAQLQQIATSFLVQERGTSVPPIRVTPARSGSMATVRIQRRAQLAEKLKDVFELEGIEEVWAEMPCWLLRSVLLQGYMYLTNSYLCFFAHMPAREDQVLKSGSLNKKTQRTKRWIKHWFVLKNDTLFWYQSSSDPYFPHGIIDLRYAISCDPVNDKDIRLRTNQKTIVLSANSIPSREEWVKAIRKVIFKAQNMGDSVKIAIPYSAILDVDKSSAMDFSETIEVKVFDKEDHFSIDSYFFAYFHDLPAALDQIRDAVRAHRMLPERPSPQLVLDTTVTRSSFPHVDRVQSLPASDHARSSSGFKLPSFLRPFSETISLGRTTNPPDQFEGEDFTHISRRGHSSFIPVTTSPKSESPPLPVESPSALEGSSKNLPPANVDHTYPPSTPPGDLYASSKDSNSSGSSWSVGVPSWLKGSSRKVFSSSAASTTPHLATTLSTGPGGVSEVYSSTASTPGRRLNGISDLGYSVLETPDAALDAEITEKFHAAFAFDEKETLLGYFPGYIFRLLPVSGRLYVSTNFFCFKSSGPLTSKTRMILPIRDILATEKSKATRFGHHGLIVIIRGHEELFFEFGVEDRRNAFVVLLERQMEDFRRRLATGDAPLPTPGKRDALILEEFEAKTSHSGDSDPKPVPDNMTDSLPAVMFTSASSTFLTFKPKESLYFTFLTIGSRGDVQPYIALAKGLLAHGHRCKIATHGEFKDWIEAHGIEYGCVGGDPAELMRICVENGTFTVSFLKEGLQMFRGWLDDLLKTSWDACQGADVLVESPSAMGGYHIAEALGIPYFRAFTMTWSRTRAYPHAFAVPERKMGGGYNYMSYVIFDQVFWRATSAQINRWRRNVLHLGSTSLDKMELHKVPFLYNFSPVVVPPPLDWPEWIRVTGYWILDDADVSSKKWTPPPDLVQFVENAHKLGKKVVYVGFGSIVVSDPKTMTRCVVEAIVKSGVHAILSKGWSDRLHVKTGDVSDPDERLPEQIYPISSIPHDWLFRRIDAACHHGGAGTTSASLRAGIPTIIKPFFGDQLFWADRVEALGVGSSVRKLTVDGLTDALVAATTDYKQIERAKWMGEQLRGEDGVSVAIESIYRDLEYARSLIKRAPTEGVTEEGDADAEDATIRDYGTQLNSVIEPRSRSSSGSASARASEDWSVISDQDDRRSSFGSHHSDGRVDRSSTFKRNSLAAAVLSVLPDALTHSPRRSLSPSSHLRIRDQ